jgi:hypothetical protein
LIPGSSPLKWVSMLGLEVPTAARTDSQALAQALALALNGPPHGCHLAYAPDGDPFSVVVMQGI